MKNENMKRRPAFVLPVVCACGIAAFTAGCSDNWIAGDAPETLPGAFVNSSAPETTLVTEAPEGMSGAPEGLQLSGPVTAEPGPAVPAGEPLPALQPAAAAPASAPAATAAAPARSATDITYKVQKDDTLGGIAVVYDVPVSALAKHNGLTEKSMLREGQTIYIPTNMISAKNARPVTDVKNIGDLAPVDASAKTAAAATADGKKQVIHVVQSGEMLSSIAPKYHVRMTDIAKANNMTLDSKIRVGQKLVIPDAKVIPAAKTADKSTAKAAAKPAKKTAKKSSEKTAAKTAAAAAAAAVAATPAAPVTPSDEDLLGDGTADVPAAKPAKKEPEAAALAEKPAQPAADSDPGETFTYSLNNPTTLSTVAKQMGYRPETLQKLNPGIGLNDTLEAGRSVTLPMIPDAGSF